MYSVKSIEGKERQIEIKKGKLTLDGVPLDWNLSGISEHHYHLISGNKSYHVELVKADYKVKELTIKVENEQFDLQVKDKMDLLLEKMGIATLANSAIAEVKAPMPGLILDVLAAPGQEVKKGDPLMILEAMKMENVLKAQGEGLISSIEVAKGDSVEKNQVLIKF